MRTLFGFLTHPVLFGLCGVGLFIVARYVFPQYESAAGALFLIWAIVVGLVYASDGDPNRKARL